MADQILRIKDEDGNVHDLAILATDTGRYALLTYLDDIRDDVNRELGRVTIKNTDYAKEATLGSVLSQLDDGTADTILSVLKAIKNGNDLILGQLDDATTDTVLTILKAVLTELNQKLEPGQNVKIQFNGADITDINPLPVDVGANIVIDDLTVNFESVVSTGNSSTDPLDANEVFTGQWEEVLDYASIAASVITDAASAIQGAVAQFSTDGVNVITEQKTTVPANFGAFFEFAPQARYFRIVYTNGPVAQTFLRSQVLYKFNPSGLTQAPLASTSTDMSVAGSTKAHLVARRDDNSGVWLPVHVDSTGRVHVYNASETGLAREASIQSTLVPKFGMVTGKITKAVQISTAGDNIVINPAVGKKVRIYWLGMSTSEDNNQELLTVAKFGSNAPFYRWNMGAPGAFSHWETIEGAVDEDFIINLSGSQPLEVNVTYQEI